MGIPHARLERANEEADRRFGGLIYAYHGRTADFWRLRDMWVIDQLGVKRRRGEFFDTLQAMFDDPSQIQLYPETRAVLANLRSKGFSMGVISNFTDKLLTLLQHHGLREFFETVTYSQEVGAEKPDGRLFSRALGRAHRKPAGAVHIGDSWLSDYMGARQAGLRAIWLNRDGGDPPGPCEMIRALSDLPPLLAQRNTEHSPTRNPPP